MHLLKYECGEPIICECHEPKSREALNDETFFETICDAFLDDGSCE